MRRRIFLILLICLFGGSTVTAVGQIDETKSLAMLVEAINTTDDTSTQASLLRGMLSGLEGRRNVPVPNGWNEVGATLARSKNKNVREFSSQLSQYFGDEEAMRRAIDTLGDGTADISTRRKALQSLLAQRNEEASSMLESLLDEPGLTIDAIRGFAIVENPVGPSVLLDRYQNFDAEQKKAVIETLATRKRYATALMRAFTKREINREEIPVHVARSLHSLLGKSFEEKFGKLKPIGDDREKLLAKYKNMITEESLANANASRGRTVFQKTCASCHLLFGEGGKIGPDLTGSNRANLDYILLNSVDPSCDVPEGYRTVTVLTVDGRLVNGVVAEEDETRLILKTVEEPRMVIAKSDIEERKISEKSMMPDGQLDEMKPQEVIDLIKYLRMTEQVEMAK